MATPGTTTRVERRARGGNRWKVLAVAALAMFGIPFTATPKAAPRAAAALPASATDESKVPHYFGPYPNWANSPQVLADAIVNIAPAPPVVATVGNPLIDRANATDYATPSGTLGPVFVVLANSLLPTGTLQSFETWNQASPGSSPTPSAGGLFHAYVLRPTVTANQYTIVYDSGQLTVPALPGTVSAQASYPIAGGVAVQAGDVIGFYGQGIPVDVGGGADILSYPANIAPVANDVVSLGADVNFPIYSQDRTYSFGAKVLPAATDPGKGAEAVATVDPKTGGISKIDVTASGSGYLVPPTVTVTAAGVTPNPVATAHAIISPGAITSVTVNEAGFGFTNPVVSFTGGNPTTAATGIASGGVDNLTITNGGAGYSTQPLVTISLPDRPGGTQATATATMDANGTITSIDVVDPGSGYSKAPSVAITSADKTNPTAAATIAATIGISKIEVTDPGAGYDAAPTVSILDNGTVDRFASATATVSVKGGVTDIVVDTPGAGYLTPGIKKFVDTLPGLGPTAANDLGQYIPVAVPDTTTYPGTDYYEIGLVQYRMKFHRDLPPTLLRGYVQLSTSVIPGKQIALTNENLDPTKAPSAALLPDGTQAHGVDNPHYLGPTIIATKDRPVRILFRNLLPTGSDGNLFIPVDTSLMGAGMGPNGVMPDPKTVQADGSFVPMDMVQDQGSVLDGVRNPECGQDPKPADCFSENRATLHLHGGITPWISDGTPHQWTTPSGEATDYPEGVSVSNVPDMPDPGPGALTFFYTNQQSARLMFYHDHAWGITRLNVYAGEAAGYVLSDAMEQSLIAPTGALAGLGLGTPLIIQDKTFVPSKEKMALEDPTWNYSKWGGEGNLWTPHVYMPAQNPSDPSGMSAFGRWMYGPWFWPPAKDAKYPPIANPYYDPTCDPAVGQTNPKPPAQVGDACEPPLIPSTPNVSVGMEAFNDTPVVNGTAYPKTTVDPKAYRFRILNAANDRFWNLQWYVADPTTGTLSEVALNATEVAAAQTDPNVFPTPDTTKSPAGPNWIQIGTEGGFLPTPVVVPNQPITWITDPTRFDVGNVDQHSLLLAPAERADVIVDFSQYRGKTLILYNDAPAAFPARVSSYDYYTGGPDLSPAGAPTTLPGYGPNTRTIMQVKVSSAAPEPAFDRPNTTADRMGALMAAFAHHADGSGVFEKGSDPIIVGQADYNTAYGTSFTAKGWCSAPKNPTAKCDGYARIQEGAQPTDQFKFDTLSGQQLKIPFQPKGIHDEMNSANFDEWGRMTANLGLEAPGATPLNQNIILYPFVNPSTENLDASGLPSGLKVTPIASAADGTQIWKITHNGVDTHPIHFHLYDVQVLNRVTWDNIIMPPEPTELGWKDTVRVSPLEDTIVAVRPIVPTLPFAVPDSKRVLNPMMPEGARGSQTGATGLEAGFNSTGPDGVALANPIVNRVVNFGWEYVFHCHILSHEEMDMMRPVTVAVPWTKPAAPTNLTFQRGSVILNWVDATPVNYADPTTWDGVVNGGNDKTNPAQEIRFSIERSVDGINGWTEVGSAPANSTTFTYTKGDPNVTAYYRVVAVNEVGSSDPTNSVMVLGLPKAPTNLTAQVQANASLPSGYEVALGWTNSTTIADNIVVERAAGTGAMQVVATLPPTATSYVDQTVVPGDYSYQVSAVNAAATATAGPVSVSVPKPGSTTLVLSSVNPSYVGQPVTFTATVTGNGAMAVPTGNVTFTVNGGAAQMVALDQAGKASMVIDTLPAGDSTIRADYAGDTLFTASFDQVVQTVQQGATSTLLTSDVPSIVNGDPVTFSATVSPIGGWGTPQGSVEFFDGVTSLGQQPLAGATATLTISSLAIGNHTITARYVATPAFAASTSNALVFTVNPGTVTVNLNTSGSPSVFGTSVTLTADVTKTAGAGTPGGSVDFMEGNSVLGTGTLSAGSATFTTSALSVGSHVLHAYYQGDPNFAAASSGNLTQQVDKGTTSVSVAGPASAVYGTPVQFTATVNVVTGVGSPGGTVEFFDGTTSLGTTPLVGASAGALVSLTGGSHSITAVYSGDTNFQGSTSAPLLQQVDPLATATALKSSLNPSVEGDLVTFTATITPSVGVAAPSGTVNFMEGATLLGTAPVNNGVATFGLSSLVPGTHSITAVYSGDTNYAGRTSAVLTQTVLGKTTTVVSSNRPLGSTFGQNITFTATVRALNNSYPTTGVVQFFNGTGLLGNGTYTSLGRWTFATNTLTAGPHDITAVFAGSGLFAPSQGTYTQQVNKGASTTTVTSNRNPSVSGQFVTFTARVTPLAASVGGTVTFTIDAQVVATGALDATGRATLSTSGLSVGSHTVQVLFGGTANYGPSASSPLFQTVNKSNSRTVVAGPGTVNRNTSVTFTATVTAINGGSGIPTGTVQFNVAGVNVGGLRTLDANGRATYTTSFGTAGLYPVYAVYSGDGNFNASTSATINQRIR